jgi:ATP-dependent exoDNAse (exonuclease V) alpha subunit
MASRLVGSGDGVAVVVGKAGAGKTAALAAAREAWEHDGYRVLGTSLAARAAKGLQDGAGIESMTLARLEQGIEDHSVVLGPNDVVVCDEAGMVGTRALARLVGEAGHAGAKVVLVGDPHQLPEIAAGGAFGALGRSLGAIELTENRRQREGWERAALDELRHGDVARGLAALAARGRVEVVADMAAARGVVVERWAAALERHEDAVMLALTRRDVAALNQEARRRLERRGVLGEVVGRAGEHPLARGEQIVCTKNDRSLRVVNGTRGVVRAAWGRGVVVETADGARVLPEAYLDAHVDYAYALTVHKAQGATVDTAVVLATDSLTREAGYVAMSRARGETFLVVPAEPADVDADVGTAPTIGAFERVAKRLSVSQAKSLALAELAPGTSAYVVTQPGGADRARARGRSGSEGPCDDAAKERRRGSSRRFFGIEL